MVHTFSRYTIWTIHHSHAYLTYTKEFTFAKNFPAEINIVLFSVRMGSFFLKF